MSDRMVETAYPDEWKGLAWRGPESHELLYPLHRLLFTSREIHTISETALRTHMSRVGASFRGLIYGPRTRDDYFWQYGAHFELYDGNVLITIPRAGDMDQRDGTWSDRRTVYYWTGELYEYPDEIAYLFTRVLDAWQIPTTARR